LPIHRLVRIGVVVATQDNQIRRDIRAPLPEIDRIQMVHLEPVQSVVAADLAPSAVPLKRLDTQGCADFFITHHDLTAAFVDAGYLEAGGQCCGQILSPVSVIEQ
jgi:hypothetical protein